VLKLSSLQENLYKNLFSRTKHESAHVKENKTNKNATDGISIQENFIAKKKKNSLAPSSLSQEVSLLSVCGGAELNTSDRRRSLTNRFHVAVRLFSNRSQMTSKCGKNKKVAHEAIAECVTDVLTPF